MPCTCKPLPSHADAIEQCGIYHQKSFQESEQLYAATQLFKDTIIAHSNNADYDGPLPVQPEIELTDFQCVAWLTYLDWALIEHEQTYPAQHAETPINPSKSVYAWLLENIGTVNSLSLEHDQNPNECTDAARYEIQ